MGHDVHANPEGSPLLQSASIYDLALAGLVCDWIENPDVAGDLLCRPYGSATHRPCDGRRGMTLYARST